MLSSSDQTTAMFFKNKIFTFKVSEKTRFSGFFQFAISNKANVQRSEEMRTHIL